jgi:hypothetical protein
VLKTSPGVTGTIIRASSGVREPLGAPRLLGRFRGFATLAEVVLEVGDLLG